MKQESLGLLLKLISNYVNHCENVEDAKAFLRKVADYPSREYTNEKKSELSWQTVHALNDGSDEAQESAFYTRLKALCSGDEKWIDNIEYLHEVL